MVQSFLFLRSYEVYHPLAVVIFITIPENELCKVAIESNISPNVKGGRMGLLLKLPETTLPSVSPGYPLLGPLHLFYHLLEVTVLDSFLRVACQIHEGFTEGRSTEGHPVNFPFISEMTLFTALAESLGVFGIPVAIRP